MTVEDIANYCEIMDCRMSVGGSETGFVHIDGSGVLRSGNYRRFHALNELASTPLPDEAIRRATEFRIHLADEDRTFSPEEFEKERLRVQALIDA